MFLLSQYTNGWCILVIRVRLGKTPYHLTINLYIVFPIRLFSLSSFYSPLFLVPSGLLSQAHSEPAIGVAMPMSTQSSLLYFPPLECTFFLPYITDIQIGPTPILKRNSVWKGYSVNWTNPSESGK